MSVSRTMKKCSGLPLYNEWQSVLFIYWDYKKVNEMKTGCRKTVEIYKTANRRIREIMRVYGYCRVSTKAQEKDGNSLEAQERF